MTLTAVAEAGIKGFVDVLDYSYENIISELNEQPLLRLNRELFSKIFKDADRETLEAVIKILRKGIVNFYECDFEKIDDTIRELNKTGCEFAVPIIRINIRKQPTDESKKQVKESFEKFKKLSCKRDEQMLFDRTFEDNPMIKIMIFVLKKEEKENGNL